VESDYRYFVRRAAEEQRRARHAVTQAARERHNELAELFASKAKKTIRLQELQVAQRA
jgi:DNA-binding protein H-NS